jgi:hypothetical protein
MSITSCLQFSKECKLLYKKQPKKQERTNKENKLHKENLLSSRQQVMKIIIAKNHYHSMVANEETTHILIHQTCANLHAVGQKVR